MTRDLNFEAEGFSSYVPSPGTSSEQFEPEYYMPKSHGGGGHGHHMGKLHGMGGHGRSSRWQWLRQNRSGSGSSAQDSQSNAWAQDCLAQLTGTQMSQGGRQGMQLRDAIRTFQTQQSLPQTGRLDDATTSALQDACGDGGGKDNEFSAFGSELGRVSIRRARRLGVSSGGWNQEGVTEPNGARMALAARRHNVQHAGA